VNPILLVTGAPRGIGVPAAVQTDAADEAQMLALFADLDRDLGVSG
jgi:hypothetical protein